jgi:hypothetical protein
MIAVKTDEMTELMIRRRIFFGLFEIVESELIYLESISNDDSVTPLCMTVLIRCKIKIS